MSKYRLFGMVGVFLFLFATQPLFAAYQTEELELNGPSNNRIDIVIMGDGYTSTQQTQFKFDAETLIAYVFNQTPLKEYRIHYNFHLVYVVSKESGADKPSENIYRDTALDATYEAYGIRRLLVVDDSKTLSVAMSVPAAEYVFVLVNDSEYGGSGGTQVAVTSVHEQSPEILTHEVGHMLAELADEYSDPYPDYPPGCYEANVACTTNRKSIKWAPWILSSTPLPTPYNNQYANVIGAFEGARYQTSGVYRPRTNCRMRTLMQPFCEICSEHFIDVAYQRISPTDANDGNLSVNAGEPLKLDALPIQPVGDSVQISWTIDGSTAGNGATLQVNTSTLSLGQHTIKADLADTSSLIRLASVKNKAKAEVTWQVTILPALPTDGDSLETDNDGDWEEFPSADGDLTESDSDHAFPTDGDFDDDLEPWTEFDMIQETDDLNSFSGGNSSDCSGVGRISAATWLLVLLVMGAWRMRNDSRS